MTKADRTSTTSRANRRKKAAPAGDALAGRLPAIAGKPGALALPAAAHVAALKAAAQLRRMELIGLAEGGRMYLWSTGNVQPCDSSETRDFGSFLGIASGHYVIDVAGHAIVVHCGNRTDGSISLNMMCNRDPVIPVSRTSLEPRLLGRVIPDPVKQAQMLALIRECRDLVAARQQAPHRARGAIT